MVCGNFILPEPASYVFFYAVFNLRNLFYPILGSKPMALGACMFALRNPDIVKVSYPFPKTHRIHTSIEVSDVWRYRIGL